MSSEERSGIWGEEGEKVERRTYHSGSSFVAGVALYNGGSSGEFKSNGIIEDIGGKLLENSRNVKSEKK